MNTMVKSLMEKENWLAGQLVDMAICIHKAVGPGLLESVYEKCFCYEIAKRNIYFEKQKTVQLMYNELVIDEGLRIDILIDKQVVVEIKARNIIIPYGGRRYLAILNLAIIGLDLF